MNEVALNLIISNQKIRMSAAIKLNLVHAFGSTCSRRYKNALAVCDEDKNQTKIVFPAGKTLAKKYIDRAEMEFVNFSQNIDRIECISILPTKQHVAIAHKPLNSLLQLVKIYSFRQNEEPITIKIFHQNQKQGSVKLLVFSPSEPKFMCAFLGQPHYRLIYVDTHKNKALAQSSFTLKEVDKISVCPYNSHLICVSGGSLIRLFKVQEYTFKPLDEIKKLPKGRRITDHAWYKRKMILVATDRCQVLLLEQTKANIYQIKLEYHNVFNEVKFDKMLITAICPFSKGFILGSNNGKFCLWTRKQDGNYEGQEALELSRKWSTTQQRSSEVTSIQISAKQDIIVISLENNDITTLYLSELLPQVSDLLAETSQKQIIFEYLYKGFHNQPITGMDVCEQRPLVATCSRQDSTIRIWNYKNYGCKLLRMFYFKVKEENESEKPLITLAFHPSGYYLAVGCVDKLRLFHVLNNELRPYRQLGVKNSHIVKFSQGGHLLAACFPFRDESTIDHIRIYNALTLQEVINFKDHLSMVKNIEFKNGDEALLSISEEGTIMEWKISDWSRSKLIQRKQMKYETCMYSNSRNSIVCFGTSQHKSFLEEFSCDSNASTQIQVDMNVLKMIEISVGKQKAILLSLQNGNIVILGGLNHPTILDLKNEHIAAVSQLIISPCGKYVITGGEDCLILIYKTYCQIDGVVKEEENSSITVDDFLADVVLINKKQIDKVNQKEKEYTKVISTLAKRLKMLSEEGQKRHSQKMLQLQLQKNRIIDDISYRIDRLKHQIEQLKQKNSQALQDLDKNNLSKAEELQNNYEQKINFQIEKYFQLEQELIQTKVLHKKQMEYMKQEEEKKIAELKIQFEKKFKESQMIYSESKEKFDQANNIFDRRLKQIEEQQQEEVRQRQIKKKKFKQQTATTLEELHEKQQKLKKEHAKLVQQRDQQKKVNEEKTYSKKKIEKEVEESREKLRDMNIEYAQKVEVLKIKEQRIIEFQGKVADLQKKKHILSYKGTQMKKAIQPKQIQIQKLKLDLIKLKKQFEGSLQRKQKAILEMQKNEKLKNILQKSLKEQQIETQCQVDLVDQIITEIYSCIQSNKKNPDNKVYYKELVKLYHKYVEKNQKVENVIEPKGIEEMTKQIVHLQKSLFQINKSNEKTIIRKNDQIYKRIKENAELVNNLNQVKKENKELLLKIRSKKDQIQKLRSLKSNLLAQCKVIDASSYRMFLKDDYLQNEKTPVKPVSSLHSNLTLPSTSKLSLLGLQPQQKQIQKSKKAIQKIECEIISEIEFTNEKIYKLEFYLKEMKEKIKKHITTAKCSGEIFSIEEDISEIRYH